MREAGGSQEFMGAVHYSGYGCPDIGARTSRFEGRYTWLGRRVVEELFVSYNGL
jgi:hypothetical protein